MEGLINYRFQTRIQKEAMIAMVKNLSSREIDHLRDAFSSYDVDNTGYLTYDNIMTAL